MRQSNNPIETALNAFSTVRGFGRERDPYEDLKMESMQLNNSLAQLQLDQLRNPNAGFDPLTEYGKALKEAEQLDALGRSDEAEQARQFAAAVLQRRQSLESPTMAFDAQGNPLFATGGQYLPGQSNPLSSVLGTSGIGGAFEDPRKQGGIYIDPETGDKVITPTRQEMSKLQQSHASGEQLINTIDHIVSLGGDPKATVGGLAKNSIASFFNVLGIDTPLDSPDAELFKIFAKEAVDKHIGAKGLSNSEGMFKEIAHMYEHPQGVSKKTYLEKMKQLREALIQDMGVMEKRMAAGFNVPAAGSGMDDAQTPRNPLTEIMMDRESAGKYGSLSDDDLIGMLR